MTNNSTDTPRTDACPYCRSRLSELAEHEGTTTWKCFSWRGGKVHQSYLCREITRRIKAEAEVERLRATLCRAVEIADEFWDNQKQAVLVYHQELADELDSLKATLNQDNK